MPNLNLPSLNTLMSIKEEKKEVFYVVQVFRISADYNILKTNS